MAGVATGMRLIVGPMYGEGLLCATGLAIERTPNRPTPAALR